jgi:hypothetical protein
MQSHTPSHACMYLGMAVGTNTSNLPNLEAHPPSATDLGAQEPIPQVFTAVFKTIGHHIRNTHMGRLQTLPS